MKHRKKQQIWLFLIPLDTGPEPDHSVCGSACSIVERIYRGRTIDPRFSIFLSCTFTPADIILFPGVIYFAVIGAG
ncbi:hypothetical protein HMPREF3213_03798 [Heyndrickxia coagulans]|uniref:Uncharacterized protein n=1 Tax=Heyndrickxia coagulans TaxID=1398 RepID=A0A133KAF0_HEYCO|nr:hypothetical protein HMPREF3213_03798 [Heyndrickxia coagulans]